MLMNSFTEKCETWVTWEPFVDYNLHWLLLLFDLDREGSCIDRLSGQVSLSVLHSIFVATCTILITTRTN